MTISERTIPALGKIGEAAGGFVEDLIENTANAMAKGLKTAVEKAIDQNAGEASRWLSWFIYLVMLIFLIVVSWKLCPIGKGRLRYV